MLLLGFGILLGGLVAAAQAAQPDEDYFEPRLDLLTTRFAHSGTNLLPSFQIGTSVVFTHPADALPIGSEGGDTSRMPAIIRLQQEITQATDANRQLSNIADRVSLSHFFRIEFNQEQVNVAIRPHAALIEVERFKIILQSHATSMVWSKPF